MSTRLEIVKFLERFELAHPVEMPDLEHIHREVKTVSAAGIPVEVVLRGDRVEVRFGYQGHGDSVWLAVSGEAPAPCGLSATLANRAAR